MPTLASAQLARGSNTSGSQSESPEAIRNLSAAVTMQEPSAAATKFWYSATQSADAAVSPTSWLNSSARARPPPPWPDGTHPSSARAPARRYRIRCAMHHGHGCMSSTCCVKSATATLPQEKRTIARDRRRCVILLNLIVFQEVLKAGRACSLDRFWGAVFNGIFA